MGNEESRPVADGPPRTLKARSVEALAEHIKSGNVNSIVFMVSFSSLFALKINPLLPLGIAWIFPIKSKVYNTELHQVGAGISTSAGIPDFRSPDTGLYANLARLNLPHPEAVFELSFFAENPYPFYTLAHELYPGKYHPTLAHSFIRLISDKGLLLKCFTQNIDCLEREAGVPDESIVEAHGSFARQRCIQCKTLYPDEDMRKAVAAKEVPHCQVPECNGLVKPDIVFFGEQLPETFFKSIKLPAVADLAIVMGSSLQVHPFAMLPQMVEDGVPRLLINRERVGDLGMREDDVLLLEDCDDGIRKLAEALGWLDELETIWRQVNPNAEVRKKEVEKKSRDEALNDEIEQLTKDVDKSLKFSNDHKEWVHEQLGKSKSETSENGEKHQTDGLDPSKHSTASSDPRTLKKDPGKDDTSESGLQHVFPHMDPKASL